MKDEAQPIKGDVKDTANELKNRVEAAIDKTKRTSHTFAQAKVRSVGREAQSEELVRRSKGGGFMETQRRFTVTGLDLSGYMVKDAPRAIAFYRDVLGLEPVRVYPEGRGAEYEFPDGTTFGLWGGGGRIMPFQPSNGILFAVDDLDKAVGAIKERGIAILMENETPVCRMAMINDTEGNMVTLHQRKAG